MKVFKKIVFTAIISFAIIFVAAYLFLALQGKAIVIRQLEDLTHKKVSIDYVGLTLPLNLEIKNLNIKGLARADYVFVSPSVLGLLTGNIVLNELKLVRPEVIYEKKLSQAAQVATDSAILIPASITKTQPVRKQTLPVAFKHLVIKDGKINFIDYTVGSDGIKITVKDFNLNLTNLYLFPRSAVTDFTLSGKIPWQQGQQEGRIEAEGWLNLFKRDMQATLKIADIDGVYLYPYYSQWVDLEKTRIEKAKLNLISNIKSVDNNLTAECHLELIDIVFKSRPPEEEENKAEKIAAAVLDIFKALNKGKIVFNFTIKTKMIKPIFGFNDIKDAFEVRLAEARKNNHIAADIVRFPGRLVGGTVKSATDLSRALIDGTFGLVKVFKDTLKYAFEKEEEQE